jgi:hypothetical protein
MNAQATHSLLIQIQHMEAQLRAMRRQIRNLAQAGNKPAHTVADLFGALEGQVSTSEEEIDAVLYKLTPEFEDEIATLPKKEIPS